MFGSRKRMKKRRRHLEEEEPAAKKGESRKCGFQQGAPVLVKEALMTRLFTRYHHGADDLQGSDAMFCLCTSCKYCVAVLPAHLSSGEQLQSQSSFRLHQ